MLKALRSSAGSAGDLLQQLLDKAARRVERYGRLRLAHAGTFFEYYAAHPPALGGTSIEHYFRAWAVRNIFDRAPARAS